MICCQGDSSCNEGEPCTGRLQNCVDENFLRQDEVEARSSFSWIDDVLLAAVISGSDEIVSLLKHQVPAVCRRFESVLREQPLGVEIRTCCFRFPYSFWYPFGSGHLLLSRGRE